MKVLNMKKHAYPTRHGGRTFDRQINFDKRSAKFPITAVLDSTQQMPRTKTWSCKEYLDQGQDGACVGFAWSHELAATPKVHPTTNASAEVLYHLAQTMDEYPGENYEGSSVLGGAKAVVSQGLMTEYRWAFGVSDLVLALGYKGPAILGINWKDTMFSPDAKGFLDCTGKVVGGHALLCRGYSVTKNAFMLHNSWGQSWGLNADCWVRFEDMDALLKDSGEACVPVKRL